MASFAGWKPALRSKITSADRQAAKKADFALGKQDLSAE
jgi:hypothetical protein